MSYPSYTSGEHRRSFILAASLGIVAFVLVVWRNDAAPHSATSTPTNEAELPAIIASQANTSQSRSQPESAPAPTAAPSIDQRSEIHIPSTVERARHWIASIQSRSGDECFDFVHQSLSRNLAEPILDANGQPLPDPFAVPLPSANELAADRNINPLERPLTDDQLSQLKSLIAEYSQRLRDRSRDRWAEEQLGIAEAVRSGRFREVPNGKWPDGLNESLMEEARSTLGPDFNISTVPGRDLTHRRVLWLDRTHSPEFFAARDDLDYLRAEFEVAVRSFFLQRRR